MKRCPYALVSVLLLSGCALKGGWLMTVGPDYQAPEPPIAKQWQAAQSATAHQGDVARLSRWWAGFNDPILSRLLAAAQTESASIAQAKARIEQARANLVGTESLLLPSLDAGLSSSRSSFSFGQAPFIRNQHAFDVQSSWEVDLFGGLARQQEAAIGQLAARTAAWHDARVAVAAELANAYLAYRRCEIALKLSKTDAESRAVTATLVGLAARAGLRNAADAALARASSAEGDNAVVQQQADCDSSIKGLVAMTSIAEQPLRALLAKPPFAAAVPSPPPFRLNALPAQVLLQRPDVAAAERSVAEASAKIGVEQAKRLPRLSLSGNITPVLQNINGAALTLAETWSYGPTLSLPLFDAGKRAANVDAAKTDYVAAVAQFRATVRTAAQEVEQALVRLASADQRLPAARLAAADYRVNFTAAQTRYQTGLGTLLDAELARRSMVSAELAVTALQQDQVGAWIALYRAAGGGWQAVP